MTESNERDRRPDTRREVSEGHSLQGAAETPSPSRPLDMEAIRGRHVHDESTRGLLDGYAKDTLPHTIHSDRAALLAEVERLREDNNDLDMRCQSADRSYSDLKEDNETALLLLDDARKNYREVSDRLTRLLERLERGTGINAIPETNDYANGWNDCRKQAFQNQQALVAEARE